jgi:hypothetical protein
MNASRVECELHPLTRITTLKDGDLWLTLQENRQKTTMFMTVFLVVEDRNDYYFLCHYGRVVTDSQSFWT